jgi:hypothetical protein
MHVDECMRSLQHFAWSLSAGLSSILRHVPACAGRQDVFIAAMMVYAVANACIGATPAAYAADVMPQSVSGFGLGIYRCAGDIGARALLCGKLLNRLQGIALPSGCRSENPCEAS